MHGDAPNAPEIARAIRHALAGGRSRGRAARRAAATARRRGRIARGDDDRLAVIAQRPAQDGKPSITYRYAGDRAVLVEYGEMEFDLTLNFFVLAVDDALARAAGRTG